MTQNHTAHKVLQGLATEIPQRNCLFEESNEQTIVGWRKSIKDLFQQVGRAVPSPIFGYLMRDFDPDKTWLELMSQQRLSAQGYIFTDQGASKVKPGDTLPRQIAQAGFGMWLASAR